MSQPRGSRVHPAVIISIVLAVLLVGAIGSGIAGVAIVKAQGDKQQRRADDLQHQVGQGASSQPQQEILTAAKTDVTSLLSYDYRTLDAYPGVITKVSTEKFGATFLQTANGVRQTQLSKQAVSKAETKNAAVVDATADTAHLLLFVDTTVTNKDLSEPQVQRYRLQVTLKHDGGQWLVDDLQSS